MKIKVVDVVLLSVLALMGCNLNSDETSGEAQLANDLKSIDSYLANKGITALKDVNGIRFKIDSLGTSYSPRFNNNVSFDYTGKLLSGTVFQAGAVKDKPVSNFITGLQIGLPLVPNGSKATFYIPSSFAYGSQGQTNIPPNSNLIFEIKLKGITVTSAEKTQLVADTVAISKYLIKEAVQNVVKDTSGLKYVITELGTGAKPSWLNKVKVTYNGYLIIDGTKGAKFYSGTNEPTSTSDSRVVNYIRGFQIGLQQLPKGSKAIFYVPSTLGFGSAAVSGGIVTVPANSNLLYEVELVDVLEP